VPTFGEGVRIDVRRNSSSAARKPKPRGGHGQVSRATRSNGRASEWYTSMQNIKAVARAPDILATTPELLVELIQIVFFKLSFLLIYKVIFHVCQANFSINSIMS
jgi:Lhr-like helicase